MWARSIARQGLAHALFHRVHVAAYNPAVLEKACCKGNVLRVGRVEQVEAQPRAECCARCVALSGNGAP